MKYNPPLAEVVREMRNALEGIEKSLPDDTFGKPTKAQLADIVRLCAVMSGLTHYVQFSAIIEPLDEE
jgi:hypothetical protein